MLRQCSKLQIIMRYLCLPFSLRSVFLQVTGLKQMCEKSLMRKVTIGNMLEMLVLADMYKAPDLREATKYELLCTAQKQAKWQIFLLCRYCCMKNYFPQDPHCCKLKGASEKEAVEGKAERIWPSGL